jgi:hypothetical protein
VEIIVKHCPENMSNIYLGLADRLPKAGKAQVLELGCGQVSAH